MKHSVPCSWIQIRIGDTGFCVTGNTPSTKDSSNYGGGIPYIKPPQLNNKIVSVGDESLSEKGAKLARILPKNSVLISCIGNLGKTALNTVPVAFNQQINAIIPNNAILSKFLFYQAQSTEFRHQLEEKATATTISIVNKSNFEKILVNIAPLNEQKRIVAKIEELFSELDNGIAALKTAREQLKVYRQSVLKHAFEGKLTAKWREDNADKLESSEQFLARIQQEREARYQEQLEDWETAVKEWEINGKKGKKPSKPRKQKIKPIGKSDLDDLFDIPEKWKWVFLSELSEYIVDGIHHTPDYTDSGVPLISAKDIRDFKINFEKARFISDFQHKELIKRCRPRKNSVLLTKSGTIGRVALVDIDFEFSLLESVSNIPILGNLQGRFVMWAVYFQVSTYFGAKNQKGVAIRHLHLEDIRRLPVPLPSYNEQTVFVEKIENIFNRISENEAVIDAELLHAETLRQSILKKAFSGQLVPQDPSDEPASKLLSRIQAKKVFVNTQKTSKSNKRHSVSSH
ncbi:restriction endonuclease subunit S [Snodgrassella sp. W8158]|uniref:restriction endonuclease subunit S n=1 Tax=Snodgrassella sp. W8158 TaxID=2751018 RepID=UPI0018DCB634|nr:restriction endonuclease subunit S [Snodgrassella sp. W8158]MBI0181896.1 restriction endonuclease subunit S [Snodgrassella sp. W8158]